MKCYAKVGIKTDAETIRSRFADAGVDVSKLILDDEVQQKRAGSVYNRLKEELANHAEPLLIDSMFSLGKNAREVAKELKWFSEHEIDVSVLDIPTSMQDDYRCTNLLYEVNARYAEREVEHIKAGQKEGARKNTAPGRPKVPYPKNWEEDFAKWEKKEITSAEFMASSGLAQGTFYNLLRRYYQERQEQADGGTRSSAGG